MKIGFDAKRLYHNQTGLGNYGRNTIRILANAYPKMKLLLFNPKPANDLNFLPGNDRVIEINPDSTFYQKLFALWRIGPINRQIKANKIEIYHGLSNELPIGINRLNLKTVVTIHDLIFIRFPSLYSWIDTIIYKWKFKYACRVANQIIAISEQTKCDLVKYFKIDPAKIKVVYQGCHPLFQQSLPKENLTEIKNKYSLPEQYILYVGTIEERKNLLTLIKAIQPLKSVQLVVVGKERPYAKTVFRYVRQYNMAKRVLHLKGLAMEDLVGVYQCASLFVYPSIFEGFGIPIIEALFSKIPVITSKGSCFAEAGGPDSLYVDPHKVSELTEAIQSVWLNTSESVKMAERGLQYAQRFRDDQIAEQLLQVYNSINDIR